MAPIKGHSSCAFVLTSAHSTQVRRPKENRNPSGRVASPRRGAQRKSSERERERDRANNAAREEEDKNRVEEGEEVGEGREKAEARSED